MKDRIPLPRMGPRPRSLECPISLAQGPWLEPDNLPMHEQWLPIVWRLAGPLDVRAFLAAFQDMIRRHEILRTRYARSGNAWIQVIGVDGDVVLRAIDMTDVAATNPELLIWERLKVIYEATVSPEHGVVRLEFFKVGFQEYLLAGFIHHVAIDNVSISGFFSELMDIYLRRASGTDPKPPPRLQYADFVLWEAEWLHSGGGDEAATYWKGALARARPFILPCGSGPRGAKVPAITQDFRISADDLKLARASAASLSVTVSTLYYTAFGLALAKWARSDQVLLGAFTRGRPPGFGEVMGCFTQLRPFFLDFSGDPYVRTVLDRAREAAIAVSDFRRPVDREIMTQLGVGAVLVNYVRRPSKASRQTPARAASPDIAPPVLPLEAQRMDATAGPCNSDRAEHVGMSVNESDVDSRLDIEPWRRSPSFGGSAALGMLSKGGLGAREFGLRVGMSQLPRLLQPFFSRDLHIGILESDEDIAIRLTTAEGGLDPQRAVAMMATVSSCVASFASAGDRRVSELLK